MNMIGFTGNARIEEALQGPLSHAYLISGPDGAERRVLADIMARALVCAGSGARPCNTCVDCDKAHRGIHPDIQVISREDKKEIQVGAIRQIVQDAPVLPNEAEHKVYLVDDADALNPSAQNAFLKVLEEPPGFVTFLLLAENPLRLLPTVRSRCVHLSLIPESGGTGTALQSEVQELADACYKAYLIGGMELLQFCVALEKVERPLVEGMIEVCYMQFAKALGQNGVDRGILKQALDLFGSLRDDIRFNVSTGHISGKILATRI